MQDILRKIPGVKKTLVGYSGGHLPEARYEDVKTGSTGHAESILIEFDKATLPLNILLDYFFRMHDPTTVDRQGGDVGSQYRSAIFYFDEEENFKHDYYCKLCTKQFYQYGYNPVKLKCHGCGFEITINNKDTYSTRCGEFDSWAIKQGTVPKIL
jgi:methionine-S-sulfoxide reductase